MSLREKLHNLRKLSAVGTKAVLDLSWSHLGVPGLIALLFTVWCLLRTFGGNPGIVRTLVTALVIVAALPLHWVLFRWLREVWLCSGAIALLGSYLYAWISLNHAHAGPVFALVIAACGSGFLSGCLALTTTWLRPSAVPLLTIFLHLVLLAIIIHSPPFGGSEGLDGIPSLAPALIDTSKASWVAVFFAAVPSMAAAVVVIRMSRRRRGKRLCFAGHDPILFEASGGHRLRDKVPVVASLGAVVGLTAAVGTSSLGSCSPSGYGILSSLLPVLAIQVAATRGPAMTPFLVIFVLFLGHALDSTPNLRDVRRTLWSKLKPERFTLSQVNEALDAVAAGKTIKALILPQR